MKQLHKELSEIELHGNAQIVAQEYTDIITILISRWTSEYAKKSELRNSKSYLLMLKEVFNPDLDDDIKDLEEIINTLNKHGIA